LSCNWENLALRDEIIKAIAVLNYTEHLDFLDYKDYFDKSMDFVPMLNDFKYMKSNIRNFHSHYGRRGATGGAKNLCFINVAVGHLDAVIDATTKEVILPEFGGFEKKYWMTKQFYAFLIEKSKWLSPTDKLKIIYQHQLDNNLIGYHIEEHKTL
jgi:hypothetical protein